MSVRETRARRVLLTAVAAVSLLASIAKAQDSYTIGVALRGDNQCGIAIWNVAPRSSADAAGIVAGDYLLAIDGVETAGMTAEEASRRIRSATGGAVSLALSNRRKTYSVRVVPEPLSVVVSRSGKKVHKGIIVPRDTTAAEIEKMISFDESRAVSRVFPQHYPSDLGLYYGGFELLILEKPDEVIVAGIEEGPGSRAGIHWGDRVLKVNGTSVIGKTASQIEGLLVSTDPHFIDLAIERTGAPRTVRFKTARAAAILGENGKQAIDGQFVPAGLDPRAAKCFAAMR